MRKENKKKRKEKKKEPVHAWLGRGCSGMKSHVGTGIRKEKKSFRKYFRYDWGYAGKADVRGGNT